MKKIIAFVTVLVMVLMVFTGCASSTTATTGTTGATTTTTAASAKFVVGYANMADTDVFVMSRKTAFIEAVKADPNVEVKFSDAMGDIQKQLDQINTFISQKVNVIVCVPVDYQGIVPGIEAANKAGIPIIALGIQSASGKYIFVGSKNYDAGKMQGDYMAQVLPKDAKVLYLEGEPGLYHSVERKQGFADGLITRTDVKIIASVTGKYDKAQGMTVMQDWIQKYPKAGDFQAVVAANDQMALGAMEALKTANRLSGVMISGVDGVADALNAIKAGEMTQSIFQNAKGQAEGAFTVVEKIKKGEDPGTELIIPFESITKDNVDKYMTK